LSCEKAVPKCAHIVVLWDPTTTTVQTGAIACRPLSKFMLVRKVLEIKGTTEFDAVFETVNARHPDGLLILSSPLVSINSKRLQSCAQYRIPAVSLFSNFARTGGLISYGPLERSLSRGRRYGGKVLKGTNPCQPASRAPDPL